MDHEVAADLRPILPHGHELLGSLPVEVARLGTHHDRHFAKGLLYHFNRVVPYSELKASRQLRSVGDLRKTTEGRSAFEAIILKAFFSLLGNWSRLAKLEMLDRNGEGWLLPILWNINQRRHAVFDFCQAVVHEPVEGLHMVRHSISEDRRAFRKISELRSLLLRLLLVSEPF